jgi:filamentous hemagglutinin
VAGGRADVIVANPYGITCSGCGFFNTDRATLTTGTPNFGADGSLAGFSVSRGDVLIGAGGLNASAQQIFDIVTRSLKLEGAIEAGNASVGIVTGNNQWSYASQNITGSTAPDGAAPSYAIDSTTLGGIHAGRIRITATEAGVGVRMLGGAAARVEDIRIDAAGKLEMQGRVEAARDVALAAAGAIDNGGELLAASRLSVAAGDAAMTLTNTGLMQAGGQMALSGAGSRAQTWWRRALPASSSMRRAARC